MQQQPVDKQYLQDQQKAREIVLRDPVERVLGD